MAERYQVRERRIWDSETDMYSPIYKTEQDANHVIGWLSVGGCKVAFKPLAEWQDDKPEGDPVNHPDHYTQGPVECIDGVESAMSTDQFIGFLRGQVIKYAWRLGLKGEAVEDARKCAWYADRLVKTLSK
jgi:hypothetical protein